MTDEIRLVPLAGLPEIQPGDDLAGQLAALVPPGPGVLVVAQKVVSKAEGRIVSLAPWRPASDASARARSFADGSPIQAQTRSAVL